MSIVTIVRKEGVSAIAADTQSSVGSIRRRAEHKRLPGKIVRAGESFLGVVGYCAHQFVLEDLVERQPDLFRFENRNEIFRALGQLHKILQREYHLRTSDDESDQPYDSTQMHFCIANAKGIFEVDSYREVFEVERFWAIGSGAKFALGAMHACYDCEWLDAKEIAEAGAKAAACYDLYCGEPIESCQVEAAKMERSSKLEAGKR